MSDAREALEINVFKLVMGRFQNYCLNEWLADLSDAELVLFAYLMVEVSA